MAKGLVYILTNPCLDGWTKIGMTERNDIDSRLRELNAPPNIPLSYRCYAVYEVDDPLLVEQRIHSLIDRVDDSLHARENLGHGRIREREFFRISPETAFGVFRDVATLRGDTENLKLHMPTQEEAEEKELAAKRTRMAVIPFSQLGLHVGDELTFIDDDNLSARIVDNQKNRVDYQGETYSVSKLARQLLIEKRGWQTGSQVNGWLYFTKDGITLSELWRRLEGRVTDL